MNSITFYENPVSSHIECEEYFPLRVVFESTIGNNRFVGFYFGDENLVEFTVEKETNIVKQMQIVICKNYRITEQTYEIPFTVKKGMVALAYSQHNDCDCFEIDVYMDCVLIKLSSNSISEYYSSGQIIFGVDDSNQLATILVTDCSSETISHIINELKIQES